MMGRLSAAAKGAKNVASRGGADEALARMPRSGTTRSGITSEGNPAGYNAGKSAYIQGNKGGYQARARSQATPPAGADTFAARDGSMKIRMSDYRRPDHSRVQPDLSQFS